MTTFEQAIQILKTTSLWNLSSQLPNIISGFQDLDRRVQALEAKAKEAPHVQQS